MNILFLANWYPTTDHPVNGLFIREHARAITRAGHKVVVIAVNITGTDKGKGKSVEVIPADSFGMETHIIHVRSSLWKWIYSIPYFSYRYVFSYYNEQIAARFTPDIVHSNILFPSAVVGDRIAGELNKKHVITEHWSGVEKFMRSHPFRHSGRKAYARAAAITCVSEFLKKKVALYVKNSEKIRIVPNVVDTELFIYKEKIKREALHFAAIATWNRFKMPLLFTQGLEQVSKEKKVVLHFIGEGEYLEEIKKKNWNFPIHYHGNLSREKVAAILQASDFFLHASQVETFSIVTAEALLTGTPVIVSNVGALPELVNRENGFLTGNTKEEWIVAIREAMKKKYDSLAIAKTFREKFLPETIGQMFDCIYRDIS